MCHGSLPTKLNWLQQWFRIKQDYCISFQGAFVLHLFFFFPFFSPLFSFILNHGHFGHYKTSFWFFPTFFLLLFVLSLCCFDVINNVAVTPGVLDQDQRSSEDGYCTDCEDYPHSFPIQNQRHRKGSRKTKCSSYDLWICLSSSEFSGHDLFISSSLLLAPHRFVNVFCRLWDCWYWCNLAFACLEAIIWI